MPEPSPEALTTSLLRSVQSGTYPQDNDIASSELSSETLPEVVSALKHARTEAQDEIRRLSNDEAPNIDGWIRQAQQVQDDISNSKSIAHEILNQAKELSTLKESHKDVSHKAQLLKTEIQYNQNLKDILEHVQQIATQLATGLRAADQGDTSLAQQQHEDAKNALDQFRALQRTTAFDLLNQRCTRLRNTLIEQVYEQWRACVLVDPENSKISFTSSQESHPNIETIADLLLRLNMFNDRILTFCRDLEQIIIRPCLRRFVDGTVAELCTDTHSIYLGQRTSDQGAISLMDTIVAMLQVLKRHLTPQICTRFSELLMPNVISLLSTSWLSREVGTSLDTLPEYERLLDRVRQFADELQQLGFQGDTDLAEWVQDAPKIWLAKRREASLVSVRKAISQGIGQTKSVERVETQTVAANDVILSPNSTADDWETGWSDNPQPEHPQETSEAATLDEEEDVSAWDDAVEDDSHKVQTAEDINEDDPDEAWDWEDRANSAENEKQPIDEAAIAQLQVNGHGDREEPAQRELTLKEAYVVTLTPEKIIRIVSQIISDARNLDSEPYSRSAIAAAAPALLSIPQLALAGFRALAPTYYTTITGGSMYLYNDCIRLVSELRDLIDHQSSVEANVDRQRSNWSSAKKKLETDVDTLSTFGKRIYTKEVDSQRAILRDLLDGVQGFVNCTEAPFAAECDNAIAMTSDRIREVQRQWSSILSRSALLQSMGSLVAMVLDKVMADICDLSDISESESTRLHHFCEELSKLSDIFTQESPQGESTDMTGVYVPNWFKFQYLSEILESSLADIKYLWNEGELSLEFEADEVVELIEALFAESDYRRKAIAEIRMA